MLLSVSLTGSLYACKCYKYLSNREAADSGGIEICLSQHNSDCDRPIKILHRFGSPCDLKIGGLGEYLPSTPVSKVFPVQFSVAAMLAPNR